jgi:hypothetical protein
MAELPFFSVDADSNLSICLGVNGRSSRHWPQHPDPKRTSAQRDSTPECRRLTLELSGGHEVQPFGRSLG